MFLIARKQLFKFSMSKFNTGKDYYKTLGISSSADQKQIKKSFRDLAKKYHPDSGTGSEEKFKDINQAYQVLSEASVRKQYDQARSYGQSSSSSSSPYSNYSQKGYGYNPQQQSTYNQNQYYSNSSSASQQQYRGYSRADGWQNQKYREQIMNQIFKQYQRQMYNSAQKNRSNYGNFQEMYRSNNQNIRQYTDQLKKRQEEIRKAHEAQEIRKEREFREYQQQEIKDLEEKLKKKVNDMKDGIVKNVHGFIKVGDFLKDTWKSVSQNVTNIAKDVRDKTNKKK